MDSFNYWKKGNGTIFKIHDPSSVLCSSSFILAFLVFVTVGLVALAAIKFKMRDRISDLSILVRHE
jgi:hypothetical protein